jgi:hypothetical protein
VKRYVWKRKDGRYFTGKGWTIDLNKAEIHFEKSNKSSTTETEVEVVLFEKGGV